MRIFGAFLLAAWLSGAACTRKPDREGNSGFHVPKVSILKSGGMVLGSFLEQLPVCRPLRDVTGRIRSLPSCPETSFWRKWTVRSGIAGVVYARNTCVEVPCTGRDVKPVPGPCGGPCSGTYNAGFTNGPENDGVTQKNYTVCRGGNNGVGGGCPCQKHECSIAP